MRAKMKMRAVFVIVALVLALAGTALAHTALCTCFDNATAPLPAREASPTVLPPLASPSSSRTGPARSSSRELWTRPPSTPSRKPESAYMVVFDSGEGHRIEIDGKKILE
jgi:hypothetical protein